MDKSAFCHRKKVWMSKVSHRRKSLGNSAVSHRQKVWIKEYM